jgi:hypothetical protein
LFGKLPGDEHDILVRDRKGSDVRLRARPTGPTMPHDLVHAAVEAALGLTDGFWGAVAQGTTFDGFELVTPGRHRTSGLKVLRRKGEAVMRAELAVGWAYRVWFGLPIEGRGLSGGAPIDDRQLALAIPALDSAAARWANVAEGETLRWHW